MASASKFSRFDLPGLRLPLNFEPHGTHVRNVYLGGAEGTKRVDIPATGEGKDLFPTALNHDGSGPQYVVLSHVYRICLK